MSDPRVERYRRLHPELTDHEARVALRKIATGQPLGPKYKPEEKTALGIIRGDINKKIKYFNKTGLIVCAIILTIGLIIGVSLGLTIGWGAGAGAMISSVVVAFVAGFIVRGVRRSKLEKKIFDKMGTYNKSACNVEQYKKSCLAQYAKVRRDFGMH